MSKTMLSGVVLHCYFCGFEAGRMISSQTASSTFCAQLLESRNQYVVPWSFPAQERLKNPSKSIASSTLTEMNYFARMLLRGDPVLLATWFNAILPLTRKYGRSYGPLMKFEPLGLL